MDVPSPSRSRQRSTRENAIHLIPWCTTGKRYDGVNDLEAPAQSVISISPQLREVLIH